MFKNMLSRSFFFFAAAALCGCFLSAKKENEKDKVLPPGKPASIHAYKIASLSGDTIDFAKYKGKYILVVNTASKCGFTPQYKDLEKLSQDYADKLVVIGFPSDNFMHQEFDTNAEIADFCEKNYGVTFPLTTKVDVKGSNTTPVYRFLTSKAENGVLDADISWNFNKFLLDKDGHVLAHFGSKVKPESEEITKYLQ